MSEFNSNGVSSESASKTKIKQQHEKILSLKYTKEIINAFPDLVAILNEYRQIVFANESFIELFSIIDFEKTLGQKPGELIKCINSSIYEGGCGSTRNCQYCGITQTILNCQDTGKEQTGEARLTLEFRKKLIPLELFVKAKPLIIEDELFIVTIMVDISDQKRKEYLERTFIHDIINSTWSLSSRLEFFPREGLNEIQDEYVARIKTEVKTLLDDIQA